VRERRLQAIAATASSSELDSDAVVLVEDRFDLALEVQKRSLGDSQYDVKIDTHIVVNEHISQACHAAPRHLRMLVA
jgi:hypothetical protein